MKLRLSTLIDFFTRDPVSIVPLASEDVRASASRREHASRAAQSPARAARADAPLFCAPACGCGGLYRSGRTEAYRGIKLKLAGPEYRPCTENDISVRRRGYIVSRSMCQLFRKPYERYEAEGKSDSAELHGRALLNNTVEDNRVAVRLRKRGRSRWDSMN